MTGAAFDNPSPHLEGDGLCRWVTLRATPEVLDSIAARLGCEVSIGEPDERGVSEVAFLYAEPATE